MEPGVQTPDYTLSSGDRVVPGFGLAAGLAVARTRPGGPVRLRVPGAADLRHRLAGRPVRARPPTSPTCTPGPRCTSRAPAGSGWTRRPGLFAGEGHIPLSATPHPSTAAAITGSTGIAQTTLEYSNVVRRMHEDPRVTLPYTPDQWAAVQAVGALVDKRLEAGDVRLTMGGEPTFVSIDDFVAAEWTIDADGPKKRERAGVLAERLRRIYAPQRRRAPRPGQVVSGRTVAALADRPALAVRRGAAVVRSGAAGRPVGGRRSPPIRNPPTDRRPTTSAGPDAGRPVRRRGRRVLRAAGEPGATRLRGRAGQARPAGPDARRRTRSTDGPRGRPAGRPRRAAARSSTSRSPSRPPTCCRCTGCRHRPRRHRRVTGRPGRQKPADASAGAAPTGGCGADGSCC